DRVGGGGQREVGGPVDLSGEGDAVAGAQRRLSREGDVGLVILRADGGDLYAVDGCLRLRGQAADRDVGGELRVAQARHRQVTRAGDRARRQGGARIERGGGGDVDRALVFLAAGGRDDRAGGDGIAEGGRLAVRVVQFNLERRERERRRDRDARAVQNQRGAGQGGGPGGAGDFDAAAVGAE